MEGEKLYHDNSLTHMPDLGVKACHTCVHFYCLLSACMRMEIAKAILAIKIRLPQYIHRFGKHKISFSISHIHNLTTTLHNTSHAFFIHSIFLIHKILLLLPFLFILSIYFHINSFMKMHLIFFSFFYYIAMHEQS